MMLLIFDDRKTCIMDIFNETILLKANVFKLYAIHYKKYGVMSTYKRFSSLLKNYESKEFYRSDISNLSNLYDVQRKSLIYPLGRLSRYELIMKDLLRYTELEHPDLKLMQETH